MELLATYISDFDPNAVKRGVIRENTNSSRGGNNLIVNKGIIMKKLSKCLNKNNSRGGKDTVQKSHTKHHSRGGKKALSKVSNKNHSQRGNNKSGNRSKVTTKTHSRGGLQGSPETGSRSSPVVMEEICGLTYKNERDINPKT